MSNKLHCPNCKSENIVFTTQTTVSGSVTSNNGGATTTSISSNHKDFWVCSDCGTKFRHIQSFEEEIKRENESGALKIMGVVFAILSIVIFVASQSHSFSDAEGFFIFLGVAVALGSIASFIGIPFAKKATQKKMEELEKLKKDCFD